MVVADLIEEAVKQEPGKFYEELKRIQEMRKKFDIIDDTSWELLADIFKINKPKKKFTLKENLIGKMEEEIKKFKRLTNLEKKFRVVTLDKECKRNIPRPQKYHSEYNYERRLELWKNPALVEAQKAEYASAVEKRKQEQQEAVLLPKKAKKKFVKLPTLEQPLETISVPLVWSSRLPAKQHTTIHSGNYNFTAKTPQPTSQAMALLKEHKDKFDHMELWWVPKDVLVEAIPPKPIDPILVGVVKLANRSVCFELCRWIDETTEEGWWSKEGY